MARGGREETDVDRRTDVLFFGLGATSVWAVLFFMAAGGLDSVAAGAVVAWIGLVGVGFCLGSSIPVALPSLIRRGAANAGRGSLDRQRDLMLTLFVLGISGQMIFPVSSQRWDHLPALILSVLAVLAGYQLAQATSRKVNSAVDGSSQQPIR